MKNILIVILIFNCIFSQGKEYIFEKITSEHGLSQNDVLSIYQDSKGYMWFGTHDGLNRYDGYEFRIFRSSTTNPNSISSNLLQNVVEDKEKNLWIATQNLGVNLFNPYTEQFTVFKNTKDQPHVLSANNIRKVYGDSKNRIWVTTNRGATCIKKQEDGSFKTILITPETNPEFSSTHFLFASVLELSNNKIIVCGLKGIFEIEFDDNEEPTGKISEFIVDERIYDVRSVIETDSGFIIGFSHGILIATEISGTYSLVKISDKNVHWMIEDENGLLWAGGFNGLTVLERSLNGKLPYKTLQNIVAGEAQYNLSNSFVRDLLIDNSGIIWIGTTGGGVCKYDAHHRQFRKYRTAEQKGSITNYILAAFEDSNENLWIGTQGDGLCYLSSENSKNYHTGFKTYSVNSPNNQNFAYCIHEYFNNGKPEIWVGTGYPSKVLKFEYENDDWKPTDVAGPIVHSVHQITSDENEVLWLATYGGGIFKVVPKGDTYDYVNFNKDNSKLETNIIRSVLEDSKGRMWFGTGKGVALLSREQKKSDNPEFTIFQYNKDTPNSLIHNYILPLFEDSKGQIWIGTMGGGVCLYIEGSDFNNGYFERLGVEEGLPNNVIKSIVEDKDGIIWISSNRGLTRYNPETKSIRNYGIKDGLQGNEFAEISACLRKDGEIIFGGVKGFNAFYPHEISEDTTPPSIVLNHLEILNQRVEVNKELNGRILLPKSLDNLDEINLKYKENNFSIHFAALHYSVPQSNQYRYKLEGFDNEWIKTTHKVRFAKYTNLKPGRYTFYANGSNGDGFWCKEPASIVIRISAPFWNTMWFRIMVILLIALSIYYRFRLVKKNSLELERIVSKRTSQLRAKNVQLEEQTIALNETNVLLEERQQIVEEQSEELLVQKEILEEVNATKDKFYTILSHDLLNPFNTLLGYLELLKMKFRTYSEEKRLKTIDTVYGSAHLLYKLMQNLLQWSRAQRGLLPFKPIKLNLRELVDEEITMYNNMAAEKGIDLILEYQLENFDIIADSNMLRTIIRNLVTNAIKFTNPKGNINVIVSSNGEYIQFKVADSGVGMSDEVLEGLFRIDRHYSTIGTAKERGTGLGLILCKEFVDFHDGKIWAESKPGVGSNIYFTISGKIEIAS